MTSQQILVAGHAYLADLRERGIIVAQPATGLVHGVIEYLANCAEVDCLGVHEASEVLEAGEDMRGLERNAPVWEHQGGST